MAMIEVLVRRHGQHYARLRLDKRRIVVGRDPVADVVLDSGHVSRRHAEISVERDGVTIADAGSTNGVLVGGTRQARAVLRPGEVARIAEFELSYRFLAAKPASRIGGGWDEYLEADSNTGLPDAGGEPTRYAAPSPAPVRPQAVAKT